MRVAVVATMLMAEPALAGSTCGSSSDGGQSSSDDSSTTSGDTWADTQTTSVAAKPECIDSTDVVGFRKCSKFGAWAKNMRLPRIYLEIGSNVRQFGSGLTARTGHVAHGAERFAFRTVMPTAQALEDTAVTSSLRIGVGLGRGAYAGTELELGGLVSPAAANAEMMTGGAFGMPSVVQERGLVLGALGVAGYRANGRSGSLSIESAVGVRSARYHFASAYQDCLDTATIVETRAVVEARARAETWLGPWVTAGATIGSNVLARGDWMAGVYVGFHSRAFAGGR